MIISVGPGPRAMPAPPPGTSAPPINQEAPNQPARPAEPDLEKANSVPPGP